MKLTLLFISALAGIAMAAPTDLSSANLEDDAAAGSVVDPCFFCDGWYKSCLKVLALSLYMSRVDLLRMI